MPNRKGNIQMETPTLTEFLTTLGSVFTSLMSYVQDVFDFIVTNPLCLLFIGCSLAFIIVRFTKTLIRG